MEDSASIITKVDSMIARTSLSSAAVELRKLCWVILASLPACQAREVATMPSLECVGCELTLAYEAAVSSDAEAFAAVESL